MLNRRAFLCGSVVTALVTRRGVEAQQVPKVPQIGVLANIRSSSTEGFLDGLRERGYIEGQNISVVWKLAEGRFEQLPTLAAELVRLNVDVIVAPSTHYAEAARRATTTIPIVFANVPDPVTIGFVQNLSKPGGNMTGVASGASATGLLGKQLELLKEMLPRLAHIGVLAKAGSPVTEERIRETRRYAAVLGIQPHVVTVAGPEEIDHAFSLMTSKRVDAVFNVPHSMFYGYRQRIVNLAAQHRLPMMCWASEFVEAGCLVSYGVNLADTVRRSAHHVDRILKGAKPFRPPRRTAHKVRFFHQPQDRPCPRPHHPAVAAAAGGSGHRVKRTRRKSILTEGDIDDDCTQTFRGDLLRVGGMVLVHRGCVRAGAVGIGADRGRRLSGRRGGAKRLPLGHGSVGRAAL